MKINELTVSIWGAKIFFPSNNDWWELITLSSQCKLVVGKPGAIKQNKQSHKSLNQ